MISIIIWLFFGVIIFGILFANRPVYIIGEVDFRSVRLDQISSKSGNLCLRYATVTPTRPVDFHVDYDQKLTFTYYQISPDLYHQIGLDGSTLMSKDMTRIVMLKGSTTILNLVFGRYNDLSILDAKLEPLVHRYSLK
jgi:hypothetical protein